MMVLRGATFVVACLLIATGVSAVDQGHYLNALHKSRVPPAAAATPAFKQQAKTDASAEAAMKVKLSRTQANLEHETKLLAMQQEEAQLLQKLKATTLARERAEETLVHERLMVSQRETSRLVDQLAHMSTHRMMAKLQQLTDVLQQAVKKPTPAAAAAKGAKPTAIPIDSKLMQQKKKAEPAAEAGKEEGKEAAKEGDAAAADAAMPTNGDESEAKKKLHKQLVAKAAEVVSAQLDGILNSEELAYIKAHNELGDSDSEQTEDGEITEEDRGAKEGESPDEHYKRLSKEADELMAKAYPFIRCEGGGAGASGGGSGGHASSGEAATGAEGSSGEASGGSGGSGGSGEAASGGTAETGTTGNTGGLLEAGATAGESGAAAPAAGASGAAPAAGETGAAAPAAGATAEGSSTAEAAAAPAGETPATPPTGGL